MKFINYLPWLALSLYIFSFCLTAFKNVETGQKYQGLLVFLPSFAIVSFHLNTYTVLAWLPNLFFPLTFLLPLGLLWAILSFLCSLLAFNVREIYEPSCHSYHPIMPGAGVYLWISAFICI